MKQKRKVIHIYIKELDKHYYFGSIAAIYDKLRSDEIGLQYQSVINYFANNETEFYENAKCIIRRGELRAKKTNRGKKALL